ncbi:methyl-accepting chemotaxis protein [Halobacteroides halobius DSM 5150]|uniref:Methyl-accepting chemotaxis protein n=1 Tax=Halobacteroides halobius (strain ATCC 35273 / DSM 5150 / MD-1) TaxID=748449 RepID=L0KCV8_HALHC|nr:methyl-accepting chemotaxis protein [Halobacteroides halobius]AGB42224.1 methyl-accepting chemotaxis protein [Halobacteroides halobius DSM 5150]
MNLSKLRDMNIKKKILLLLLIIGGILIGLSSLVGRFQLNNLEEENLKTTSKKLKTELKDSINAKKKVWLTNSLQIANNPIIEEAMAKKDRKNSLKILEKYSQIFKKNTGFNNIKVHLIDKQLNSFVKSWNSESFGESLKYSDAYQKVKDSKEPLVTKEESPKGLRLKALYPVHYQEKFVGMVNFEGGLNSIKRTLKSNKIDFLYFLKNDYLNMAKGISDKAKIKGYTLSQKDVNQEFLSAVTSNLDLRKAIQSYHLTDDYLITAQKIKSVNGEEVGIYLLGQPKEVVMKTVNKSKGVVYWTYFFFLIIFILQLGAIFLFISKNINQPLDNLIDNINEFTDGNLKEKINIERKDEIGILGIKLEEMRGTLKEIIEDIFDKTEDLSAYSEELSASAEEGNATIETSNELVEDISANIEEISASTQEVTSFAQQSSSKTKIGSENIDETLTSIREIKQSTNQAVNIINELDNTSNEIGKIVEMINNIAEQTNLLALNASIEAARASSIENFNRDHKNEAGAGFAVVAEEIRELAEETNKATQEIANLITETQDKANNGLEAVKEVKDKALKGEKVAKETKKVLIGIKEASNETATQIEQTANATQDVAEKSEQVRSSSNNIENMSNEITNSSQELANMAQELQSLLDEFEV